MSGGSGGSPPKNPDDPVMEIRCPTCKATIKVALSEAEATMKVKCPKGHDVPLVKMV
ncbi:MJ0042-type zinc finger domain-containing protein [Pendulispora albinea]|uniref:Uncharacterized protein n=1 Tax=Pendulispora albinea TaxID=2741071 RepID=A0ABZ2LPT0_9BACT